jgi:hypothetical protein
MLPTIHTIDEYLAAFRARRECCRALLELSREQQLFIAESDYNELITVLEMKQRLVDELAQSGSAAWQSWKQYRAGFTASEQQAGDALLAETESLLALLLKEEQGGVARLTAQRDTTERELAQINSVEQIEAAYRPVAISGSQWGLDVNL